MLFRAAACTGALYHIDLYLVCGDLPNLEAGVYHFGPHDFSLRELRAGDYRGILVRATGGEPAVAKAPAVLICTSTYWRNAWKYRARAYRHCYWDSGTILANLLGAAAVCDIAARVVAGFEDTGVSRLLGLDGEREAALTLVPLGEAPAMTPGSSQEVEPLSLETEPLSGSEVDYPVIRAMHAASSLESEGDVAIWRKEPPVAPSAEKKGRLSDVLSDERFFRLRAPDPQELSRDTFEEVVRRRGSTREFSREPITFSQLSTMLRGATRGFSADFLHPGESLNDLYLIVNAVDDLPPGAYVFHRDLDALELLREGDFRREAGHLGLGQEIPADASVNVFCLTGLGLVLERFGNRGYRAAQLEAGIISGKLYLLAYAQRLGASGLTFFDDDVTDFFSPHAASKSVMMLVALGRSVRRKKE
jgi:SagB-type dehydrogenase family enzyme